MRYIQTIILLVVLTIGNAGMSMVYSNSNNSITENEYANALLGSECVEYVGGEMVVLSGPSCSAGDATCSCSEGQCCSAGGGSCECNNCDDEDDDDSGIDWTLLRDLLPILLP